MPGEVITGIEQVSTAWLTAILLRDGALQIGEVRAFELGAGQGNWSTNANLKLEYSPGAQGSLPQNLFLKMVYIDLEDEAFSDSEVTYYMRDYLDVQNAPILHCYDAVYSSTENRYHLLLDDVSHTHVEGAEKELTLEYGLALAEGLAILHARWWGQQRLAEADAPLHSPSHIQNFVDIAEPGMNFILQDFSLALKHHWPEVMRQLFRSHPGAIIRRAQELYGFTLIHGDVGENNILVPRQGERPIYIIDRQPFNWSLTTWLGVYDLAYAIVLDWPVEKRRKYEIPMLRRYHNTLMQNGVRGYSWEQLYDDYRLCAAMGVYVAVEYCRGGVNEQQASVWLPMLQRALTACDDLDCQEQWLNE